MSNIPFHIVQELRSCIGNDRNGTGQQPIQWDNPYESSGEELLAAILRDVGNDEAGDDEKDIDAELTERWQPRELSDGVVQYDERGRDKSEQLKAGNHGHP